MTEDTRQELLIAICRAQESGNINAIAIVAAWFIKNSPDPMRWIGCFAAAIRKL